MNGKLISTRDLNKKEISYTDALLEGLAPDGGLYVPTEYPQLSREELNMLKYMPYSVVAFAVKVKLVGDTIPAIKLQSMINTAYTNEKFNFKNGNVVPIRRLGNRGSNFFIQNLSLGPTAAFKDMALQLLGREINYELRMRDETLTILGATSGDTGSSAEAAFKGLDRVKLFMLSPQIGMSDFQKAQMGVLSGGNIVNIGIDGRFDDCQRLLKALKKDPEFAKLGAVNSINWGRISSQVPYFVSGYLQTISKLDLEVGSEVDFAVPTGNFGNVLAGYVAKKMGLPIRKLIVATNENNVLEKLIENGIYKWSPSQITSSPSMDISEASNYERLAFDLLGRDPEKLSAYMGEFTKTGTVDLANFGLNAKVFAENGFFVGTSTHADRLYSIQEVYFDDGGIIDPHTADAVYVAKQYREHNVPMIVMETALSVKFEHTINEALGFVPKREERFVDLEKKVSKDSFYNMAPDIAQLKNYMQKNL